MRESSGATRACAPLPALLALITAACIAAATSAYDQTYIVCKKPNSHICQIWPMNEYEELVEDGWVSEEADNCVLVDKLSHRLPTSHSIKKLGGGEIDMYCSEIIINEMKERGVLRARRQVGVPPHGRYRGQTQSQYLAIDHDGKEEGKAEAHSAADSSRASVSGNSGMGQAQSQSTYDTSCDDCYGRTDIDAANIKKKPYGVPASHSGYGANQNAGPNWIGPPGSTPMKNNYGNDQNGGPGLEGYGHTQPGTQDYEQNYRSPGEANFAPGNAVGPGSGANGVFGPNQGGSQQGAVPGKGPFQTDPLLVTGGTGPGSGISGYGPTQQGSGGYDPSVRDKLGSGIGPEQGGMLGNRYGPGDVGTPGGESYPPGSLMNAPPVGGVIGIDGRPNQNGYGPGSAHGMYTPGQINAFVPGSGPSQTASSNVPPGGQGAFPNSIYNIKQAGTPGALGGLNQPGDGGESGRVYNPEHMNAGGVRGTGLPSANWPGATYTPGNSPYFCCVVGPDGKIIPAEGMPYIGGPSINSQYPNGNKYTYGGQGTDPKNAGQTNGVGLIPGQQTIYGVGEPRYGPNILGQGPGSGNYGTNLPTDGGVYGPGQKTFQTDRSYRPVLEGAPRDSGGYNIKQNMPNNYVQQPETSDARGGPDQIGVPNTNGGYNTVNNLRPGGLGYNPNIAGRIGENHYGASQSGVSKQGSGPEVSGNYNPSQGSRKGIGTFSPGQVGGLNGPGNYKPELSYGAGSVNEPGSSPGYRPDEPGRTIDSGNYRPSHSTGSYGPGKKMDNYAPGLIEDGYGPGSRNGVYKPGQTSSSYRPSQIGGIYVPGQTGGNYEPGQASGSYGPGQTGGNFGPGQTSGIYGPDQTIGGYGPGKPSSGYGPGQIDGRFSTSQSPGSYGPSQTSGSYGPGQIDRRYSPNQNIGANTGLNLGGSPDISGGYRPGASGYENYGPIQNGGTRVPGPSGGSNMGNYRPGSRLGPDQNNLNGGENFFNQKAVNPESQGAYRPSPPGNYEQNQVRPGENYGSMGKPGEDGRFSSNQPIYGTDFQNRYGGGPVGNEYDARVVGQNNGFSGVPQNFKEPNTLVEGDDSAAEASVSQVANGTTASASSRGGNDKGRAQTNVHGTYSGSGSFSAQALIAGENKEAESEVTGGKKGASSSAQGSGRNNKSQANVQLGSETGSVQTQSLTNGAYHSSNSQVQGSVKGGMADAQARGPGSTSSQAQIGFTPYKDGDKTHDLQKIPFVGGGLASAQSSGRTGQSQSQLHGTFKYGITYNGAAQAGASVDKDAVFPNRLSFDKIDVFDEKKKNINVNTEKPNVLDTSSTISTTPSLEFETTEESINKSEDEVPTKDSLTGDETEKDDETLKNSESRYSSHTHLDHHKSNDDSFLPPASAGATRSFQPSYGNNGAEYEYTTDREDVQPDEYDTEGQEEEQGEYSNYDEIPRDTLTHQSLQSPKNSLDVKQTTGGNTQHIVLGTLKNHDAEITQKNSDRPDETKTYQPGERVPGTGGYTIPIGFTGNVKSVASKEKTYVVGSKESPSQAQTVTLTPGSGKVKYSYPSNYGRVEAGKLRSLATRPRDDRYVSVSKSVARDLDAGNNVHKQYSHSYYTKSSSCGFFTFTCTMVSGADGKKKVCRPKIPTNPDGTPIRC